MFLHVSERRLVVGSFVLPHLVAEVDDPNISRPLSKIPSVDPRLENIGVRASVGIRR